MMEPLNSQKSISVCISQSFSTKKMAIQIPSTGSRPNPHFVLVPLMAQGHTIPMIDLAHSLALHGATVTLITTPVNAARISSIINRVDQSGLPITFVPLRFPAVEVGLPEGSENIDMLPSRELIKNFFDAICMLKDQLMLCLHDCHPRPTCIISDKLHYWTLDVARAFGIPRIVFHGFGCFALLCIHNVLSQKIDEKIEDEDEPFVLPGLPPNINIEMTRAQLPNFFAMPGMEKHRAEMRMAELASDGVVVNSFDDLEPLYSEWYEKAVGKKVWTVGPLSLSNRDITDIASRGNKASLNEDHCLKWLDLKKRSSVLYVSFGSLASTIPSQLIEIGLGLEASSSPFIWVIKAGEVLSEVVDWLSEFEERTRDQGLIIRGWAPQMTILSHPAAGGFMTHCGWNSTLESVSVGVPMITWPHFADQFLNERLVVDVLRIGVAVGVKVPTAWGAEKNVVLVKSDGVEKAVKSLFDVGKEAEERRKRAREFGLKSRKAVEEGGSSHANLTRLIQDMISSN